MKNATEQTIADAVANTTWGGAGELVRSLRRQGFRDWSKLPAIFRSYESMAAQAAAAGY